jgi:hypothetical protein
MVEFFQKSYHGKRAATDVIVDPEYQVARNFV